MIIYNESLLGMLIIDVAPWTLMSISVEEVLATRSLLFHLVKPLVLFQLSVPNVGS
jgi:hypothetical protein